MIPHLHRNTRTAEMSRPAAQRPMGITEVISVAGSPPTFVMNRPVHLPGLAAVSGGLPTPIEFVSRNVFPDHSLQDLLAVPNRLTLENHLSVAEIADEVEVTTFIVDPRLLPTVAAYVKGGNAGAAQMHRVST